MRKHLLVGLLILMLAVIGTAFAQPGRPARPWVGISIQDVEDGVEITSVVPDSPAAEAGLEAGDIIQSVDGESVATSEDLIRIVRGSEVGAAHVFGVLRGEETLEITVTLSEAPARENRDSFQLIPPDIDDGMIMPFMGLGLEQTEEGWRVTEIMPGVETLLQEGDIIISLNGESVLEMEPPFVFELLTPEMGLVEVVVLRDGEEVTLEIDPGLLLAPMPGMTFQLDNRIMLGVQYQMLDEEAASEAGIEQTEGALITRVLPGTPAEEAGLQEGDVILSVDGTPVNEENPLPTLLMEAGEDETVTLEVLREGETLSVEVTLVSEMFIMSGMPEGMPGFPGEMPDFEFGVPPNFFENLDDLLDEFDLNLPEGGSLNIVCSDADGEVFSLQFEVDENGNTNSNLSTPGLGFDELENLDLSALTCEVNSEVDETSGADA